MKTVTVKIAGTSPLLMHKFPMNPIDGLAKMSPEEQAEFAAYRDPDSQELFVPAINIHRCFISAARFSKGKGRASLKTEVSAGVFVSPVSVGLGTKEYEVDSRPVVVSATRGRIIRHRPVLESWALSFEVEYDALLMTEEQLRRVVDDAGQRVGLLDFRPEKFGPFGRFSVCAWKKN